MEYSDKKPLNEEKNIFFKLLLIPDSLRYLTKRH